MIGKLLSTQLRLVALISCYLAGSGASSASDFDALLGFWKGPGRIEFTDGSSEALVCKAYYASSDQPKRLSIVLRGASRSNKIELRAKLLAEGARMTGTWEERTFNASGTVSGTATGSDISLTIDGGGFSATMLVNQDEKQQTVSISAQGVAFTKVSVSLSRNAIDLSAEHAAQSK